MKTERKFIRIPVEVQALMSALSDDERGRLFTALVEFDTEGVLAELEGNERFVLPVLIEKMRSEKKDLEKSEAKHKYGEYGHVLLTDAEADKLRGKFGGAFDARIARLDRYKEQTGKSYRSDYMTLLEWQRRDEENGASKANGSFDTEEFFSAALKHAYAER